MDNANAIKPFWSFNDKLERSELESQIEEMKKSGIDGFFMHARGGLLTEYMSEEWFELINACLDRADELDMQAWAYDENGWPSGFANGIVPSVGEDYCQKQLVLTQYNPDKPLPENILGFYTVVQDTDVRCEYPEKGCFIISYKVNPYYTDTFNSKAIACFIENTHQKYYERFAERFGTSLKGFFTDEPQYGKTPDIPWSTVFEAEFSKKYGYSLLDNLAKLYYDVEGASGFRFDFYSMLSELFVNSFIKQMYDWCSEHNCKLTGHLMMEDGVTSQIQATGGVMPCYEYFHEPGIDWLGKLIGSSAVPRQLSSVSYQLGKKNLTETFATVGWDISLNELKWIAQWHYVNGATSLCPHLEGYSLKGCRKRDYPASLFIQLPWFKQAYCEFANYFSRLGELLDSGEDYAPLLVIHPMHSAYALNNPNNQSKLSQIDAFLSHLCRTLDGEHIPYHFGDETLMKSHCLIKNSEIVIGKCAYKAVLIPKLVGLDSSTFELLSEFAASGGQLYYIGEFPHLIDGRPERERLYELFLKAAEISELSIIRDRLSELLDVSIKTDGAQNGNIGYAKKLLSDGETLYYMVNHSNDNQLFDFEVAGELGFYEYDHLKETQKPLRSLFDGAKTKAEINLAPYGSILIKSGQTVDVAAEKKPRKICLNNRFNITARDDNAITLDCCEYRIDGGEWLQETAVITIQQRLLELKKSCDIELRFKFNIDDNSNIEKLMLCAETPDDCAFTLNGKSFAFKDIGYFVDKSIRKTDISRYVKKGENELIIARKFYQREDVYRVLFTPDVHEVERNKLTYDVELESIYLIGDFSVRMNDGYTLSGDKLIFSGKSFSLAAEKDCVDIGNLTVDGFTFFSGAVTLSQSVNISKRETERYIIGFSRLYAPAAELYVNSERVGLFGFAPYELDVTDYILNGINIIEIKLFSGNRNLLGPHHRTYGEACFVNPSTFTDKPEWGEDPNNPTWTDNYSFVKFGIDL